MDGIPDPMIGGLILGKFNRAQELKVTFELIRESSFRDVPQAVDRLTFTGKPGCGTIFTVVIPKGYAGKMGYDG